MPKGMFDSSEAFTAYATIDAGMYMMCEINNKNGGKWDWDKNTGIEFLISKEDAAQVIIIMKDIISAKRYVGLPFKDETKVIELAKELLDSKE